MFQKLKELMVTDLQHSQSAPNGKGITVVLADDHRLMREGIRRILEGQPDLDIVGEADDGHQALSRIRESRAHVAVIDLNMPGLSGVNLIRRIRQEQPHCAVLVLSMYGEELYAMRALKAGAQGYMTKDAASEELVRAVRKVAAGGCYLSRHMAERVAMSLTQQDNTPRHERLSDREFEIFRGIVAGQRISEISRALHLSVKTVSTHKTRILQKMQLDSAAALIRYGLEHRLFPDPGSLGDPHGERLHGLPAWSTAGTMGTLGSMEGDEPHTPRASRTAQAVADEGPHHQATDAHHATPLPPAGPTTAHTTRGHPHQGTLSF